MLPEKKGIYYHMEQGGVGLHNLWETVAEEDQVILHITAHLFLDAALMVLRIEKEGTPEGTRNVVEAAVAGLRNVQTTGDQLPPRLRSDHVKGYPTEADIRNLIYI